MKAFLKICLLLVCAFLLSPSHGMANGCPDRKSGKKSMDIHVQGVSVEHNTAFMTYLVNGQKNSMRVNYGDLKAYQRFLNRTVKMVYRDVQYYNDHDDDCTREKEVVSIGGIQLSN